MTSDPNTLSELAKRAPNSVGDQPWSVGATLATFRPDTSKHIIVYAVQRLLPRVALRLADSDPVLRAAVIGPLPKAELQKALTTQGLQIPTMTPLLGWTVQDDLTDIDLLYVPSEYNAKAHVAVQNALAEGALVLRYSRDFDDDSLAAICPHLAPVVTSEGLGNARFHPMILV